MNTIQRFINTRNIFYKNNKDKCDELTFELGQLKLFKTKYKYLKAHTVASIDELFRYEEFKDFTLDDKKFIIKYMIKKIRGIYKHGQSCKTEISCEKIYNDLKKEILSIVSTKNTLLANAQFTERLKKFMRKLGFEKLNEIIMIISSKEETLGGDATHCKNLDEAWKKMCETKNNFKIIFVCSNSTRINDIYNLCNLYPLLNDQYPKQITFHYDEAHNPMEGVPVYRELIENIIINEFIEEFIPISASYEPIVDETNSLWKKNNLKKNRFNFINEEMRESKITSTSKEYSSIDDAIKCNIEEDFSNILEQPNIIPEHDFRKIYPTEDYAKKGRLNFCSIAFIGDEIRALNFGVKLLSNEKEYEIDIPASNNFVESIELTIFESGLHIVCNPKRKIINWLLMKNAVLQSYNPVAIGLYGGKIHFRYKDILTGQIKNGESTERGEINEIIFNFLDKYNLINRTIIIFGSYQSIGESNTFVNWKVGYVRSVTELPGCNLTAEQRYQLHLRECFVTSKFIENIPNWDINKVVKFIIAPKSSIEDSVGYEIINDELVTGLLNAETNDLNEDELISYTGGGGGGGRPVSTIHSIPIMYEIKDFNCEHVKEMIEIMKIPHKTLEHKCRFQQLLSNAITEETIKCFNKNKDKDQINLQDYVLTEFRCYTNQNQRENYRFDSYSNHFLQGMSLSNGTIKSGESSIYCCLDRWIKLSEDGITKLHTNFPSTFYITYVNK